MNERLSEGSRLVDAFVEENTGEEVENALTKGPEIWVLVLALLVRWKGQHCLSEPQIPHQ